MKVAVFGDSYADEIMNKNEVNYKSWVELLREKYYPDLTCYGMSGSSLYFSYNLFLEHQSKFDKIIFVTTTPGRILIPKYIKFNGNRAHLMYHINSIDTAIQHLDEPKMTEEGALATKAAIEYFKYLHDPVKDKRLYNLMKEHIRKIRSDTIMIETTMNGLSDISYYEFNPTGYRDPNMWKCRDARMCHLSPRNNEILADKMFEWCNGAEIKIDVKDFEVPSKEELERLVYIR